MAERFCVFLMVAVLFLFFVQVSWGQVGGERMVVPAGPIEIEADEVVHLAEKNLYKARGNVEIKMGQVRLTADEVTFHTDSRIAEAKGHVELTDGGDVLQSDSLRIDVDAQTGVVENARLRTRENFYITGKRIEKLGPKTYRVYDGTFTSCGGGRPDWSIKAKRLDLTVEGYGVARHSFFRVKDVPVAYLPVAVYPVKTKRQTGFLSPDLAYSDKTGFEVNLPFFWAISQDKDATFYLNWRGRRGFKPGVEFRYALTRNMEGQANFHFIDDQVAGKNRWAFLFRHEQRELPLGFYARANVNLVSDNDYVFDFEEDFPDRALIDVRSDRYLKSTVFGGRIWPVYNLVGEFTYFDDLSVEDNGATVQLLPEVALAAFDQPILGSPLYIGGEFTYTNFWREEGVRGSRLDLFPELSLPFRPLRWLRFLPTAGLRETLYWLENDGSGDGEIKTRTLPSFNAFLSTTVSRIFDKPFLGWMRTKHLIRPEIRYTYIPRVDQEDLPAFDEKDQIPRTNEIRYGLSNFVDARFGESPGLDIRRIFRLEVFQSYSLGDPFSPEGDYPERQFSNIFGRLWLDRSPYFLLRSDAEYSLIEDRVVLFNAIGDVSDTRGDSVGLEYRFSEDALEQLNFRSKIRLLRWTDVFGAYRYDLRNDLPVETRLGLTLRSRCWEVSFSVEDRNRSADRTREREVKFYVSVTLVGLGSLGGGGSLP